MRKKIGEVLVEAGLITEGQVEKALTFQKGKNKRLGKILMDLGYVTDEQIAEALSRMLAIPHVDCRGYAISREILAAVPKEVAEKKIVFPLELKDRRLLLAMADPLDWRTVDDIAFNTGLKVSIAVATENAILDLLEKHYGSAAKIFDLLKEIPGYEGVEFIKELTEEEKEKRERDKEKIVGSHCSISESPPIVKLVTMIIADAIKSRASDIHIEPQELHVQVRYRIDGELRNILRYPKHIQNSVISRIKIISNLDITNRRLPQDGRCTLRFDKKKIDMRVSTLPSVYGEKIVIRLLDLSHGVMALGQIGMEERVLSSVLDLAGQPQGMLLVTGPTGSGKTSTLYGLLQHLQSEAENIITIEDPVEYKLPGITQVGVNEAIGLTFASVLRSVLRQDPDIIMVGEIRDRETAEIAARAALTGHLVLSTLHTNDSVATIARLMDIGLEPFLVTSAVSGVIAQRLVRKICPYCRIETVPEDLDRWGLPPLSVAYRGAGCDKCQNVGYLGRAGVYEFLELNTRLKRAIAKHASEEELWEIALEAGTKTLFDAAWEKVRSGITTVEEVISKVPFRHQEVPASQKAQPPQAKVLAYEIPASDLEHIRAALEPEGYRIVSASGGRIAEISRRETPDLVVLEMSDKVKEVLQQLRGDIRNVGLPVLLLSDAGGGRKELPEDRKEEHLVFRPLDPRHMVAAARSALSGDPGGS